ncbi:MAG: hypothetical protein O2820_19565 [Planctomycetota bacterium]|nr:hypothetical protein [Planctomycetota bacterium]MDA1251415.1 hypothetical protein [Planctomycetota bacterium]
MSLLRIFRPEDDTCPPATESFFCDPELAQRESPQTDGEPVLLSFEKYSASLRGPTNSQLRRARQIHAHCQCPECRSALVVPLVLNDGRRDRSGEEVPGTSTLVGFRCDVCSTEWPA